MRRKKLLLTFFLVTPILALCVILLAIKYTRPEMNAPPVGAGAGNTGGANAIGEYIAHGQATSPNAPKPAAAAPEPAPELPPAPTVSTPSNPARTVSVRSSNLGARTDVQVFAPQGTGGVPMLLVVGEGGLGPPLELDAVAEELMRSGRSSPFFIASVPGPSAQDAAVAHAEWIRMSVLPVLIATQGASYVTIAGIGTGGMAAVAAVARDGTAYKALALLNPETGSYEEFPPPARVVLVGSNVAPLAAQMKNAGAGDGLLVLSEGNAKLTREELERALVFLFPPDAGVVK